MANTNARETHRLALVNNTDADLRDMGLDELIIEGIRNGSGLPEDVADLFHLEIIEVEGKARGILTWA